MQIITYTHANKNKIVMKIIEFLKKKVELHCLENELTVLAEVLWKVVRHFGSFGENCYTINRVAEVGNHGQRTSGLERFNKRVK